MKPIIIKSRDGLDLVSYLTLPKNYKKNEPVPLVLVVRDCSRETYGYNSIHQFLSNRGYAVLSVNYRGYSGFGEKFRNAGNKEWGNKMQNDLIDAVKWTIINKVADPKKIAICGFEGYGGYAALTALTQTPDLFACGIDLGGYTNLLTYMKNQSIKPYFKELGFEKKVGGFKTSKEKRFLKERSPLTYADKIKKPLLIGHPGKSKDVKTSETKKIVSIMKKNKVPVIYALYPNETWVSNRKNRLSFMAILEQFLSNHLGGKAEPIGDAFEGVHFTINGEKPSLDKDFQRN